MVPDKLREGTIVEVKFVTQPDGNCKSISWLQLPLEIAFLRGLIIVNKPKTWLIKKSSRYITAQSQYVTELTVFFELFAVISE